LIYYPSFFLNQQISFPIDALAGWLGVPKHPNLCFVGVSN
jgi:hypothetical protein